jgi:phosphoserine phosphatase
MAVSPPFERIVFDCDSTLSTIEGIEELSANDPELRRSIEDLTASAMNGKLRLDEVYGQRLSLINPKQIDVMRVGSRYVQTVVPGARELISGLRSLGKEVLIISGGVRLAVASFAAWLGVGDSNVHAVKVFFDAEDRYHDFDRQSVLARNDGKSTVLRSLPPARTVFVGDGITDAEARDAVECFICFGGVVLREEVAAKADAVVSDAQLAALLPLLCSAEELERLSRDPRHSRLLALAKSC